MPRFIILFLIVNLLFVVHSLAQPDSWSEIDSPYNDTNNIGSGTGMYYSENLDLLIVNGKRTIGELDEETGEFTPELTHFYPAYNGENWTYLSVCENSQFALFHSITDYSGGIVTTGPACNGELGEFEGLSYYQNGSWTQLGAVEGTVNVLKTFNDTLYVAGFFTEIGGDQVQYLAKYDGSNWMPAFSVMPSFTETGVAISTIDYFQNEWYIGGNWQLEEGSNFLVLREGEWQPVKGSDDNMLSGTVHTTAIYNDELYVGGYIQKNGNVGHGLQKWDGSDWHEVGESLQSQSMNFDFPVQVHQLLVHDNALFARGNFYFASGNYVKYIARWDGNQWCGLQTFQVEVMPYHMASYNGSLISQMQFNQVGLGYYVHDGHSFYPCSEIVSIAEVKDLDQFSIHPNPTSHFLTLTSPSLLPGTHITVYNLAGQQVYGQELSQSASELVLDARQFGPAGMYLLHVQPPGMAAVVKKVVVQE